MKDYVCEDVKDALAELEEKIQQLLCKAENEEQKKGVQLAYDALKETQEDWKSEVILI